MRRRTTAPARRESWPFAKSTLTSLVPQHGWVHRREAHSGRVRHGEFGHPNIFARAGLTPILITVPYKSPSDSGPHQLGILVDDQHPDGLHYWMLEIPEEVPSGI